MVFTSYMLKFSLPRKTWLSWLILGIGLLTSTYASFQVKQSIDLEELRQFSFVCDRVTHEIREHLAEFELILRGGVALFAASEKVNRNEWHAFVQKLQVDQSVHGSQGISFSLVIPADQLAAHNDQMRKEGYSNYTIQPTGKRDIYTSIIYLEPSNKSYQSALGYDMYADPVSRVAMEQARDTGRAALTGKVELLKEYGDSVGEVGVIMYLPVYRNGETLETAGQRRSALTGWVHISYGMNDFMTGILGDWDYHEGKIVNLEVYDGDDFGVSNMLFDSKFTCTPDQHSIFYQQRTVEFNGHRWLLEFDRIPETYSAITYTPAWLTLIGGFAFSGLLFGLFLSLLNTRNFAVRIAEKLTETIRLRGKALKESEAKIHLLLDSTAEAIYGIDMNGNCTFCNDACLRMLKYDCQNDLLGKNMHRLIHGKYANGRHFPVEECRIYQAFQNGVRVHADDEVLWRSDNTFFHAEYWSFPQIRDGVVIGAVVSFLNISERKQAESDLKQVSSRLSLAVRAGGIGILDYNIVDNILLLDDPMLELCGIERMNFGGNYQGWLKSVHVRDRERLDKEIQMAIGGEKEFDTEFRVIKNDGSIHYIRSLAVVHRDNFGNPERMISTNWDITEIRNSERAKLEDSENRYRSIFNGSPDGILIADVENKKIQFGNSAACKMFGYNEEQLKTKYISNLHPVDTLPEATANFERQARGDITLVANVPCLMNNGINFYADVNSSQILINGKKHLVGFFRDITERKRTEDRLARREAEMRTTLYSIGDAVMSLDINGYVSLMNPIAEKLTGWGESEALGKPLDAVFYIINEETRSKICNSLALMSNVGNKIGTADHTLLISRDGSVRTIGYSSAPIFDQGINITGYVLVFRDLTKERESANIILQQFAIIETYVGLVALADLDGRLIYINKGGTKMLGASLANELLNQKVTDFIVPANFRRKSDKIYPVIYNDREWSGESTLKRIDGSSIPVSQTIFLIRDDEEKPKHIGIIMMDISVQKELQEKLLMSEKLAVMGRLMADVSHELNNPLAIVIGRTELILSHIDEQSTPFKAKLEIVLQNARRCKTILSNLLTYSRTIGKKEGAINLPDLINEAINSVNYECDLTDIEVVVNCYLPLDTTISGNKDALLSVFINLIRNAWRAMDKKGSLSFLVTQYNENNLCIEIQDSGIGISKEKLQNIFKPFSSGWGDGKGTGLGLATSLGIIETHGGKMWVQSEGETKGTKFTILLPYRIRRDRATDRNQSGINEQ